MKINERIRALREQLGLSQEELALRVGYSDRSSIAKVESGKVDVRANKIPAYARALGVTTACLLGLDGEEDVIIRQSDDAMLASLIEYLKENNLFLFPEFSVVDEALSDLVDENKPLATGSHFWSVEDAEKGIRYELDDSIIKDGMRIMREVSKQLFSKNPSPLFSGLLENLLRLGPDELRILSLQVKGLLELAD
ncbi:MAG: helix-turn-helix domain-containing protein [Clostridia bacterium]|nr:helix-turn-helix domain-containing protein [Clostridia bacterium]